MVHDLLRVQISIYSDFTSIRRAKQIELRACSVSESLDNNTLFICPLDVWQCIYLRDIVVWEIIIRLCDYARNVCSEITFSSTRKISIKFR